MDVNRKPLGVFFCDLGGQALQVQFIKIHAGMGSDLNIEIKFVLAAESRNDFQKRIRGDDPGRDSVLVKDFWR